ncbi:ion channel protein [Nocardia sp. NBC_01327]|uniref:ion channel protein n=1 Tax=Nocardia sp. NBC_01327 TaxID=2903593 RepID=UPI002E1589B5|nr:ion channel protein [Nocardia sp. NBC_01327]
MGAEVGDSEVLDDASGARWLARSALPALVIGIGCALILVAVNTVAERLRDLLWTTLPASAGVDSLSGWWIFAILTCTGIIAGLLVWKLPGHAGPDPATIDLLSAPLPLRVLPGLALVLVVGMAGGVSLGPENPITAVNTALAVWLAARWWTRLPSADAAMLAAAGTVGALFGTPIAAALVLTEIAATTAGGPLWNRLFAPLVAAGAGAMTTTVFAQPAFAIDVPGYHGPPALADLVSGTVVGLVAALLCLLAVYAFPLVHSVFHRLRTPFAAIAAGGVVLGALGALGGHLTLFKGLDEMKELTAQADSMSATRLVLITAVKLAALVVAASCGFRGGRIFVAAFIGVGVGSVAHQLVPGIPPVVALACGVLGAVLVIARYGWLALFMGAVIVGDYQIVPVLCLVIAPLWLLVMNRPPMLIRPRPATNPV